MEQQKIEVAILAAGRGTRMRSTLPKVLHPLGGLPLLAHVIAAAESTSPQAIHLVYGHGGDQVKEAIHGTTLHWVEQLEQRGTGDAVAKVLPAVDDEATLLILYGDVPLIQPKTLEKLIHCAEQGLALLTVKLEEPRGYGRIVRNDEGDVVAIVEERDATAAQREISEINSGIMALPAALARRWISQLTPNNAQGEYYLTDIIALAVGDGVEVNGICIGDSDEVAGVNSRVQLAQLERVYQQRTAHALMEQGVTLRDPTRLEVRGRVEISPDVTIDCNVILEGEVTIASHCVIGANSIIRNSDLGQGVVVEPMSIIDDAQIAAGCLIGPFARIRPGTVLATGAKVGNFVEIKKSRVGVGSKVNHLSYIGDTEMGDGVNVGAGTITCNYDGAAKHKTVIGDGAFIGSDTQLVAPVTVGANATIGAGSTITQDTPDDTLTLSRSPQKSIQGWRRATKEVKKE
ncbi:MAG: bifunctional UDP-N-acetylglucosamine diphosphorylase/glucosamine-1-phosphate N-acetyltransferase GlmU [Gammaproteobacteria bacterium]|nr:bifunctional UDP-N-acetylglucosamine diphosphorylase/glucosamine-1-phosphate N-acetyltransferase GlmU [Gammaproteobacteria bacterium]